LREFDKYKDKLHKQLQRQYPKRRSIQVDEFLDIEPYYSELSLMFDKYMYKHTRPNTILANIPLCRGHQLAPVLFEIAQQLYPENIWVYLDGDTHSTVYTRDDGGILFDLIFWYYDRTYNKTGKCEYFGANNIFANVRGKKYNDLKSDFMN